MTMSARGVLPQETQEYTMRDLDHRYPGVLDGLSLMAGSANVIMQLSWPAVGYGVFESKVENGDVRRHPIKRARTTLSYLAVAIVGTRSERMAYRQAIGQQHAQVHSTSQSPVSYNAFNPELQLWVAACINWGARDMRRRIGGEQSPEREQELYVIGQAYGTTLQVRPDMWPETLADFDRYMDDGFSKCHIDPTLRQYLRGITELTNMPLLRPVLGRFNRFLTIGFLPPILREQMGYDWSERQQKQFDRYLALVTGINRLLPRIVRQFPFNILMWDFRRRLRRQIPLV